jgi:hypothetical protein
VGISVCPCKYLRFWLKQFKLNFYKLFKNIYL